MGPRKRRDDDARDDGDGEPLPRLRLRCAWCGRMMRAGVDPESSGICAECLARVQHRDEGDPPHESRLRTT